MQNKKDLFAPPTEAELSAVDMFAPPTEQELSLEPEEISGLESALRGAAQEASFGLADEITGLAETGLETVKGNVPLSASELLKAYQKLRDESRQAYKAAEEANPKTYLAGQVAGGILPAVATGGTAVAGKLAAGAATKAGIGQLMKEGAKSGLKYGLAQGVGKSEAEIAEGELGQLAKDVASEGAIGGVAGGVMPLAAPALKGAGRLIKKGVETGLEMVPGYEAMKTGFELGKEGIAASAKSLGAEYKKIAEEVTQKIKTKLQTAGVSKAEALELADQMNISMNAGDDVQTAIEKASRSVGVDENQKRQYIEFLKRTMGEDVDLAKATQQLEQKRAVAIEKASREGKQLQTTTEINKDVADVLIDPELQGRVVGFQDKLVKVGKDGKSKTSKLVTLKTVKDPDIPVTARDIENLSPTEMADFLKDINRFTGNLNKQAQNDVERNARQLASQINEKLNTALQGTDLAPLNNEMANLFNAIKNLKMPGNVTTKNRMIVDEQIAQVQKKLMDISDKGAVDKELIFKRLAEASPEFTADKNLIKLLDDYKKIAEKGTGAGGFGLEALLGSAQRKVTTAANIAGRASRALPEVSKKIVDASPEFVKNLAASVQANPKFQAFAPALQNAASATTEASRKAAMFALYQQPAFREMVKQMSGLEGATQKALDEYNPPINPPINPDSPQRSPSFNLPIETEEEEDQKKNQDPLNNLYSTFERQVGTSGRAIAEHLAEVESNFGKAKGVEEIGMTKGVFHITKDAALGVAPPELKRTIQNMSESQYAQYVANNPRIDAELSGRYSNSLLKNLEANGVVLENLSDNEIASVVGNLYNFPNQPKLKEALKTYSERKSIASPIELNRLKQNVVNQMDVIKADGKVSDGLVKRRNKEKKLFLKTPTAQNSNQASTQDVSGLLEKFASVTGKGLRSLSNAIIPEAAAAADMPNMNLNNVFNAAKAERDLLKATQGERILNPNLEVLERNTDKFDNEDTETSGKLSKTLAVQGFSKNKIDQIVENSRNSFNTNGVELAQNLINNGYTPVQAAAIAGNIAVETMDFRKKQEIKPTVEDSLGGYGYAQWTGARAKEFFDFAKNNNLDPSTDEANLAFLLNDLKNKNTWGAGNLNKFNKLTDNNDIKNATDLVRSRYLRPGVPHAEKREKAAKQILEELKKTLNNTQP